MSLVEWGNCLPNYPLSEKTLSLSQAKFTQKMEASNASQESKDRYWRAWKQYNRTETVVPNVQPRITRKISTSENYRFRTVFRIHAVQFGVPFEYYLVMTMNKGRISERECEFIAEDLRHRKSKYESQILWVEPVVTYDQILGTRIKGYQ